jgi:heptose III glucuronosyltransferase
LDSNRILLSIITPAYNASGFLPALIASVEAAVDEATSKATAVEWILVDDGSTDNTAELFRNARSNHPTWQLVQQPNAGVAVARNSGLAKARGEYIWFVDADDLIVPQAMPALISAVDTYVDAISFQAERFTDAVAAGQAITSVYRASKPDWPQQGISWVSQLIEQKDWKHYLWQYWYRRQLLTDYSIRFAGGIIHEDIAFVTEAALRAESVSYVDEVAYRYRENPASLTNSGDETKLLVRIESYFVVLEQLRALNADIAMPAGTRSQLEGEVVGQALQVFELSKQLVTEASRRAVLAQCRKRRFAQQLLKEVHGIKRLRQVLVMWLKQSGLLPLGSVSAK